MRSLLTYRPGYRSAAIDRGTLRHLAATGRWELFNLAADIGETNDLADERPELLADLVEAWERFAADAGVAY